MGLAKVSDRLGPPDTVHMWCCCCCCWIPRVTKFPLLVVSFIRGKIGAAAADGIGKRWVLHHFRLSRNPVGGRLTNFVFFWHSLFGGTGRERQTPSISTSSIVQSKMPFARLLPPSCPIRRRLDFPRATFSHLLTRLSFPSTHRPFFCAVDSNSQTLYNTHTQLGTTLRVYLFFIFWIRSIGRKNSRPHHFTFASCLFTFQSLESHPFSFVYIRAAVAMFFSFTNDR